MIKLFMEGGALCMGLLTVELIALLLAAWKAPAWVKEIGLIALMTGILNTLLGLVIALGVLAQAPDVVPALLYAGFRAALITILYGCLIYVASLVIRIVQKPRI